MLHLLCVWHTFVLQKQQITHKTRVVMVCCDGVCKNAGKGRTTVRRKIGLEVRQQNSTV